MARKHDEPELLFSKRNQVRKTPKPERFSRKAKASSDWVFTLARQRAVQLIWDRAMGSCEHCGANCLEVGGEVHEQVHRAQGGSPLKLENMQLLCPTCHKTEGHGLRVVNG